MTNKIDYDYLGKIKEESSLWNKAAEDELKKSPPDYSYYKHINNYAIISLNNDSTPAHFSLSY